MNAVLRQALAYADAGWPVFPCRANAKVPAFPSAHADGDPARTTCRGECGRYGHGFKDATTDPAVIRRWWSAEPARNVAIATGAPGPDVLDVDVKPDGSGWAAFNRLKAAGLLTGARALIRTPSGGMHAYFAGTSQPSGRLVRHFLDFKAAGGYVLAPPSVVGGRPYELLDRRQADGRIDWQAARRLLDPPRPANPAREQDSAAEMTPRRRDGILRKVTEANQHGHWNDTIFWAACRLMESGIPLAEAEALILEAARPWDSREEAAARRTVASAARKALEGVA